MDRITISKPKGKIGEMFVTVDKGKAYVDFCETRDQHTRGAA